MTQRVYRQSTHRFFDNLVTFLGTISNLGIAINAVQWGNATHYPPTYYIALEGSPTITNVEFHFFTNNPLKEIIANRWPSSLELVEVPLTSQRPPSLLLLTGLQLFQALSLYSTFNHYFEQVRPLVEARYGNNPASWPTVWNFGRIIRNAFAHGGQINFQNPNAPSVTWRTVTYSPADNGRQVFPQDLNAVEVILLMEEMDAAV